MYADDTSLYLWSTILAQLNETINKDLNNLDLWLIGNKLSMNVAKTISKTISTYQKN